MENASLTANDVASHDINLVSTRRQHYVLLINRVLRLRRRQLIFAVTRGLDYVFKVSGSSSRQSGQSSVDIDVARINSTLILERYIRVIELHRKRSRYRFGADPEEVSPNA